MPYEKQTSFKAFAVHTPIERRTVKLVTQGQRQEMVSGTLVLLCGLSGVAFHVSRALALKGDEVL